MRLRLLSITAFFVCSLLFLSVRSAQFFYFNFIKFLGASRAREFHCQEQTSSKTILRLCKEIVEYTKHRTKMEACHKVYSYLIVNTTASFTADKFPTTSRG